MPEEILDEQRATARSEAIAFEWGAGFTYAPDKEVFEMLSASSQDLYVFL